MHSEVEVKYRGVVLVGWDYTGLDAERIHEQEVCEAVEALGEYHSDELVAWYNGVINGHSTNGYRHMIDRYLISKGWLPTGTETEQEKK